MNILFSNNKMLTIPMLNGQLQVKVERNASMFFDTVGRFGVV